MTAVILVFKFLKSINVFKNYISLKDRPDPQNRLTRKNQQDLTFLKTIEFCNFWMHTETKYPLVTLSCSSSELSNAKLMNPRILRI